MTLNHNCWLCHGWQSVDKRQETQTAWSDRTGGERGERIPIYSLHVAFGTYEGQPITCPVCKGTGKQ